MDERAAARIFGLSLCEYADLEAYPDEWFSVLPTQVIAAWSAVSGSTGGVAAHGTPATSMSARSL